jgi:predicted acylesterase/phospholipase RssA
MAEQSKLLRPTSGTSTEDNTGSLRAPTTQFRQKQNAAKSQAQPSKPSAHLKAADVKYLALEGGGGKGITYLGAIEALEELKILPANQPAGKNQIRGVAGSSAGAITALALALGFTSKDFRELLGQPERFNAFYDAAGSGLYRTLELNNKFKVGSDPGVTPDVVAARKGAFGTIPRVVKSFLPDSDDPMLRAIAQDVEGYLYNVLYDRGIFPGFAVREFFRSLLSDFVLKQGGKSRAAAGIKDDGSDVTFEQFFKLTKIDLVVTGVNVAAKRVGKWSQSITPDFPVADAVSISMNIPMLFKPVRWDVLEGSGFWVDGGLLNNLPLHLFDEKDDNPKRSMTPGLSGLHPNVLALRLTPGMPEEARRIFEPPSDPLNKPTFEVLGTYLLQLGDAIMSPSEEGQIRNQDERNQIIELLTGELSLTEFAPPQSKWEWPVKNAKEVVLKYFAKETK